MEPREIIVLIAVLIMSLYIPCHPQCMAPTNPVVSSLISNGTQSAVIMPTARLGWLVIIPSAIAFNISVVLKFGVVIVITLFVCCWFTVASWVLASSPIVASNSLRFCITFSLLSDVSNLQFAFANTPLDTPSVRVKNLVVIFSDSSNGEDVNISFSCGFLYRYAIYAVANKIIGTLRVCPMVRPVLRNPICASGSRKFSIAMRKNPYSPKNVNDSMPYRFFIFFDLPKNISVKNRIIPSHNASYNWLGWRGSPFVCGNIIPIADVVMRP